MAYGYPLFRVIRRAVAICYPKITVLGQEHLPEDGCILVGNHSQLHGPIISELYCPGQHYTWCAGQMMDPEEVTEYAYQDFWSGKPRWQRPFFRFAAWTLNPLFVCIFRNAATIGVYRDARIMKTFKKTLSALEENARVMIFPECYTPHNHIVHAFQEHYIDVAKLHFRRTGKRLAFVPVYVCPRRHEMHIGQPVLFDPEQPIEQERLRINDYLMDTITAMAEALPRHKVVPYPNIPKKDYPENRVVKGAL